MSLGKKIIILATIVVLGMQCLSCVLEIGFLYKRIEEGHLSKYKLSGMSIRQKLERSLLYGKTVEKLNYSRLIKGLVPEKISNLAISDNQANLLFTLNRTDVSFNNQVAEDYSVYKDRNNYILSFPLYKEEALQGNLLLIIADQGIKEQILPIITEVVIKFFLVFLVLILMLYWILHHFMEKPFGEYIDNLKKGVGIDPLFWHVLLVISGSYLITIIMEITD